MRVWLVRTLFSFCQFVGTSTLHAHSSSVNGVRTLKAVLGERDPLPGDIWPTEPGLPRRSYTLTLRDQGGTEHTVLLNSWANGAGRRDDGRPKSRVYVLEKVRTS